MKILKLMMCAALAMMVVTSCSQKSQNSEKEKASKVLVLYYSQTSNTKTVAQEIANRLNADIEEIALVEPYDTAFQATIDRCKADREKGILPEIKPLKSNVADYDTIFLGYPIWFGTYAPPIASLLDKVDLSGKWVMPFCTFGSGGLESSVKDLTEKQPDAKIMPGYGVRAARMDAMPAEVDQFLKESGFIEGPYVKLPEFSKPHALNDAEAKIFDAAVGNYPMIKAKAVEVATRSIPYGIEYLYTAVDMLSVSDLRPEKTSFSGITIKIYVTVANGKLPVFTRVVR